MSQIEIRGIRGFGHHGVLPEERAAGQEFLVDVFIEVDTSRAEKSDEVAETVHYGEVASAVYSVITGTPVNLIERLAALVAEAVLAFEGVASVQVRVHKPNAPISVPFTDVSVTVQRAR